MRGELVVAGPIKIWQNGLAHQYWIEEVQYQLNSKIRLRKENVQYAGMDALLRVWGACFAMKACPTGAHPYRVGGPPEAVQFQL